MTDDKRKRVTTSVVRTPYGIVTMFVHDIGEAPTSRDRTYTYATRGVVKLRVALYCVGYATMLADAISARLALGRLTIDDDWQNMLPELLRHAGELYAERRRQ